MKVYLDHAATSPVKPEVFEAMKPYLTEKFGNPSSIHSFGQEARKAVDEAREKVARFFNCKPGEVIFTSGGTEADNLAILGIILASKIKKPHIITSKIEHHAVLETCEHLKKNGLAEVIYIGVDKEGIVDPHDIKKAIKKNTALVTIMYANNETGAIQPIREIGKIIKKENRKRSNPIYFHTDAVQAAGYLPCDVLKLHAHLLTIAGHKIGAPKGIGVLCIRKGIKINPIFHGGAQEYGIRPGTENVAGIVGLGKAVEIIASLAATSRFAKAPSSPGLKSRAAQCTLEGQLRSQGVKKLRDKLAKGLLKIKDSKINGNLEKSAPHILNISFAGVEGESVLLSLDQEGIAASTGSACTSQSLEPSHVIMAMYNDEVRAHSSIRFSLGKGTTEAEIDYVIAKMRKIIKRLRSFSPTYKS
jgi:cysteine desulfurase